MQSSRAHTRSALLHHTTPSNAEGGAYTAYAHAYLVHLAAELPVRHVELRKHVAGRQRHLVQRRGVPRRQDDAAVRGVVAQLVDDGGELVHASAAAAGRTGLVMVWYTVDMGASGMSVYGNGCDCEWESW